MATFAYKALDAKGVATSGEIEGESKAAVAATLRNRGLTVIDVNEVKKGWGQISVGGRIKPRDVTVFSRQFATMVGSGLSMLRCLYVLEEQTQNKKLAAVIGQVRADVEAGRAGVLGMTRMIRVPEPAAAPSAPMSMPAAMETNRGRCPCTAPARSAASSTRCSTASPPSSRARTASAAR